MLRRSMLVAALLSFAGCYVYVPQAYVAPPPVVAEAPPPPPAQVVAEEPPPAPPEQPVELAPGELVGYYGAHPIPDEYGGGWCAVEGPHVHPFAPVWYDQYVVRDGYFVFAAADGYFYGGPHPIPGGGWCGFDGPHRHRYPPGPDYRYDRERRTYVYDRDNNRPIVRAAARPAPGWHQPGRVVTASQDFHRAMRANAHTAEGQARPVENRPAEARRPSDIRPEGGASPHGEPPRVEENRGEARPEGQSFPRENGHAVSRTEEQTHTAHAPRVQPPAGHSRSSAHPTPSAAHKPKPQATQQSSKKKKH
jgi:hypothetical protein